MTNLKLRNEDYQYDTAEVGFSLEVRVGYSKGGSNFLSGSTSRRGIYIYLTPATIEERVYEGKTYRSRIISIGGERSGLKGILLPLARKNAHKLEEIAATLDPMIPEIAKLALDSKRAAIIQARDILESSGLIPVDPMVVKMVPA